MNKIKVICRIETKSGTIEKECWLSDEESIDELFARAAEVMKVLVSREKDKQN